MKRFDFRPERVLNWKRQLEKLAQQRLWRARVVLDAAEACVRALEEQLARLAGQMTPGAVGQPISWMDYRLQALRIGEQLEQAQARAREAQRRFDEAAAQLVQISQEVEILRQLRQQHWQAYRRELQRAEQVHLDEVGLKRWFLTQENAAD